MKMKSLLSSNGVKHILFATFMLLPLISIFARVIYVQSNENAYESYYGETINEETITKINNINELNNNDTFNFYANRGQTYTTNNNLTVYITDFHDNDNLPLTFTPTYFIYYNDNSVLQIQFRDANNNLAYYTNANYAFNFNFKYVSQTGQMTNENFIQFLSKVEHNKYSYLDNAFEYSLSTFVEENNFNLNFFNWFDNLFLSFEGHNALYVNFINWYLNYALLVASVYLLFYVIYWFIDFVRGLLDKFSRKVGD